MTGSSDTLRSADVDAVDSRIRGTVPGCASGIVRELADALLGLVVDLGAGGGSYLDPASTLPVSECARRSVGVDLRPQSAHRWVVKANLEERLPFASGVFRAAVCNHVLEHMAQPAVLAAELSRVLEPGGFLVTCVPNGKSVSDRLFRLKYALQHSSNSPDYDPHRQTFTKSEFSGLLENAGFEPLYSETIGEGYSWLRKHPWLQRAGVGLTRALRPIAPEAFAYGWFFIARKV